MSRTKWVTWGAIATTLWSLIYYRRDIDRYIKMKRREAQNARTADSQG